jgi:outer membrane protein OmpA-like peptidoglycan-associated protein
MASTLALRALLGAGLGLGALDLAWLNLGVVPRLVAPGEAAIPEPTPRLPERVVVAPRPEPETSRPTSQPIENDMPSPAVVAMKTSVYFATRSVSVDSQARATLEHFVSRAGPAGEFVLEGHADHRGDESLNRELSKQRAKTVAEQLEQLGVTASRIRIGFVGERAASSSDELWRDRRVDIQITGGQQ